MISTEKLHTTIIKSEDDRSFNYMAHMNGDDVLTLYLSALQGSNASYKAEVSLETMDSIAQQCDKPKTWLKDMLLCREPDILWYIETESASAKVTWKKKLTDGMKWVIGTVPLEEHGTALSDMLSICVSALQQETTRADSLQQKCGQLEAENSQLRDIADQAVQARTQLEDDLIAKFACLLNEKKAKIRALQEMADERLAEALNSAPDGGAAPGAARDSLSDADADDPDADAYDQDTEVDADSDGGSTPPHHEEDSLELNCDGLDGAPPLPPKRPAPDPLPSSPPGKRQIADSDDLLDIV